MLAKSGAHGGDEASQGEWRTGKVLPPLESRNRMGDREPRMNRNFGSDAPGRPERREMALTSIEGGVDKWERRGPLPPLEISDRRQRTGPAPRSGSSNFGNAPSHSPSRESPSDTGEWRSNKPIAPAARSDGRTSPVLQNIDLAVDTPPASPSLSGSPVMQRRKLALLPRSEHPQEPTSTPLSVDEVKSKSNPFGAARPVDTDTALKKVEEKLAKEKEHKDELASTKANASTNLPPASPAGPRHDKARPNPKQLLRRTSANPAGPATGSGQSEVDAVVAAKPEAQDKAISEGPEKMWRKPENPVILAPSEEEVGWETVPSRSKKVNGVGARH